MARLITAGAEYGHPTPDGLTVTGTVTAVTSPVRSGLRAYQVPGAGATFVTVPVTQTPNRWFYCRAWFRADALPGANQTVAGIYDGSTGLGTVVLTPAGTLQGGGGYFSTSISTPVVVGRWYCLELALWGDGATTRTGVWRVDGTELARVSQAGAATGYGDRFRFGSSGGAPTGPVSIYLDDIALNDDTGSGENDWPVRNRGIVRLAPVADVAVGNWTQGAGGTGNRWDSVDNIPPAGVSNASATDLAQIRNPTASSTRPASDIDLRFEAYSAKVPGDAGVVVVQAVGMVGHSGSTALTPQFEFGLLSSPAETPVAFNPTSLAAAGAFPGSGWLRFIGISNLNPSVALSDQPVVRLSRRNAQTDTFMCCAVGLTVEFGPSPFTVGGVASTVTVGGATITGQATRTLGLAGVASAGTVGGAHLTLALGLINPEGVDPAGTVGGARVIRALGLIDPEGIVATDLVGGVHLIADVIPPGPTAPAVGEILQLRARIFDLQDNHLATLHQHQGIEVTWPLNDSRLANVTVSIYEDALRHIRPLDRLLTIEYGPYLLFKGYVVKPIWNAADRTVQINAHDATLKLKHHYHRYGDIVVDYGYPFDGLGFRRLLHSTVPTTEQVARGVISSGLTDGENTVPDQGPKPAHPNEPGAALWGKVERGSNVWESLIELTQSVVGFEFDFEPIDEGHPPVSGDFEPGTLAQVHTRPVVGTDRTGDVVFHYGFGADNAEGFTYEPDGDVVRNYWVEVNPGGDHSSHDAMNKALVHDEAAWLQYGIYQGWESAGQKWPKAVLLERARAWVKAYARSPEFFTVDPKPDALGVPRLVADYTVGDTIRAAARVGMLDVDLTGRVIEARVSQRSPAGGANVTLGCVPAIESDPSEGEDL